MSLNKVMLIGNVGVDPEVRYLDNSQAKVARIRLATTERYTDRNGESRENTEWHTISCWRKLADLVEKYVKKGTQIYVEGRLQTREWTDNTGAKRYSTEINADNIQLLGRRADAPASNAGGYASGPAGPGGYQAPYQPATPAHTPASDGYGVPASQPYQAPATPSFQSPAAPAAPAAPDFGAGADDDLPF